MDHAPRWLWVLLVAAVAWHATVLSAAWPVAEGNRGGADFASFHFATQVAAHGQDPYDTRLLSAAAREEGLRRGVHPFFYPPPFLLTTAWTLPLSLRTAYRTWFWLDALAALAAWAAVGWWWRAAGPAVPVLLAGSLAWLTALPNNHVMGQMNLPVLLLVVLGLGAAERGREGLGGALLGLACMMKMAPALFVAWWLLHGRWRPVAAACAAAVGLSVIALPLVGPVAQIGFYTEVLPGFGSGAYNGLRVGIDLYGNHSLANLFDELWPAGPRHLVLSERARAVSAVASAGVLAATGWAVRRRPADVVTLAGQVGAIAAAMLLVPVITYEHHLVWLVLPAAAAVAGLARGRLHPAWSVPVLLALVAWCWDLQDLKELSVSWVARRPMAAIAVREVKLAALVVLYSASVGVALADPRRDREAR